MEDKIPKVFISYSWTSSDRVLELAERLVSCGVDVTLDKWDLKEGNDKYHFMEQCVTDPQVDKVLLICDKAYAEKANSREGGVGDETVIISSEVYGKVKQEKFLPIIFEVDENGNPYRPTYIKSQIYFDMSTEDDRYEQEYEKLLRNIHNKPLYKKPAIGKIPEWLENDTVNFSPIRDLVKQTRGYTGGNKTKADFLIRNTINAFLTALSEFEMDEMEPNALLKTIDEMKPLRDLYVDFVEAIIYSDLPIGDTITSFFEQVYNETHNATGRNGYSNNDFEQFDFFIWETFIVTTAILMYYEKYTDLGHILHHAYFLRESFFEGANLKEYNYCFFRKYMHTIEERCKPNCDEPRLYSLTARILTQREKKPILTVTSLTKADILLYQLYNAIDCPFDNRDYWFPTSYIYYKGGQTIWIKLKSASYCEKVLPLFQAKTIDELKEKIQNCKTDREMRHKGCWEAPPNILTGLKLDEIASLL